jgi:hypothetical protein
MALLMSQWSEMCIVYMALDILKKLWKYTLQFANENVQDKQFQAMKNGPL